jgi:tRNA threonylcarbamoyladenosine modification (KEOPS) complex  Pcc1 subunit
MGLKANVVLVPPQRTGVDFKKKQDRKFPIAIRLNAIDFSDLRGPLLAAP